ncbi:MAG TPA: ABC transporter permease [Acidimicrobiia bacterium]|nr:ABC transporter permease [Acidimicrobiia bacterium]
MTTGTAGTTGTADAPTAAKTGTALVVGRRGRFGRNAFTVAMIWRREMVRFLRSRVRIITGLAQPVLFLFVLGVGLGPVIGDRGIEGVSYQAFLFPGVLVMSIMFTAMFSAISIVWDREFGFLREMLVAPVSRASLVLGKAVGSASIAVLQGTLLLLTAPLVDVDLGIGEAFAMIGLLMLLAFAIVSFGIVVASRMQRVESFQVVMGVVVNPMLFLSGALFPLQGLPDWLSVASKLNPITYGVDPVRRVLLGERGALTWNGEVLPIWTEILVVVVLGAAMLALATRLFSRSD